MRRFVLVSGAVALLAASPAAAQFSLPADWAEKPSEEALSSNYPKLAQQMSLEGFARLACDVTLTGTLEGCRVDFESPKGIGFGPSALKMSESFKMRPPLQPGARYPNSAVRIPIHFRLPATPPPPPVPPVDPGKKPLVDQLAREADPSQTWISQVRRSAERLTKDRGEGVDEETAAAAVAASLRAADQLAPEMRRDYLAFMADALTTDELSRFLAFAATPTGKRYFTERPERIARFEALRREAGLVQRVDARAAFCAELACDGKPAVYPGVVAGEDEDSFVFAAWTQRPSAAEQQAIWPFASIFGVSLSAILSCAVGAQGAPEDCEIVAAGPPTLGAEKAALELAALHRVNPRALTEGAAGRRAPLTLFVWGHTPKSPAPFVAKASPSRLELAKQVYDAQSAGRTQQDFKPEDLDKAFGRIEPAFRSAAEAALRQGYRNAAARYRLGWADLLGLEFTEPELREILEFQKEVGPALARVGEVQKENFEALGKTYSGRLADVARDIFCAERTCKVEKPPPDTKPAA
jgi:TonB family protein